MVVYVAMEGFVIFFFLQCRAVENVISRCSNLVLYLMCFILVQMFCLFEGAMRA